MIFMALSCIVLIALGYVALYRKGLMSTHKNGCGGAIYLKYFTPAVPAWTQGENIAKSTSDVNSLINFKLSQQSCKIKHKQLLFVDSMSHLTCPCSSNAMTTTAAP